ncbi:MAG: hypothetical protein OHK0013_29820 [Sandaracinaceae bacterium]
MTRRESLLCAVLGVLLVACSSGAEAPAPADLQADVRALQNVLGQDPATLPLREVDEAIRDDRPVLAADLIRRGAVPATERQIRAIEALRMTSAEGRRLRSRCVRLHRDRLRALASLEAALSRGIGHEDEQLLDAMHADAEVQVALVRLHDELGRIVPWDDGSPPLEERGVPRLPSREPVEEEPSASPDDPNPGAADPIPVPEE